MNLLPKATGTRPRVACEIAPEGVVAARSADALAPLTAVTRVALAQGAVLPGLKPGNVPDRIAVAGAVRRALESIGCRPNARGADVSLVIPDGAVRVLLLDFDTFPSKLSDALPMVRFRLKKLVPFEADEAMVTYQVLSQNRSGVRVLAVAIPRDVLAEYETVAREAGFEPGAVLPSTLAGLAAVNEEEPTLVVNAGRLGITTAIVSGGQLLLHRSVDLQAGPAPVPANLPPALFERDGAVLPLVDRSSSAAEWAAQEPLPEHGRNRYPDRLSNEAAVQGPDGITGRPIPPAFTSRTAPNSAGAIARGLAGRAPGADESEPASVAGSPYASPTLDADLKAELHHAILDAPTAIGTLTDPSGRGRDVASASWTGSLERDPGSFDATGIESGMDTGEEIAHAVSVAAAYFEDTLSFLPKRILSSGPLGAETLANILSAHGIAEADELRVRELVEPAALGADAATASVPRSMLGGVLGAVRG